MFTVSSLQSCERIWSIGLNSITSSQAVIEVSSSDSPPNALNAVSASVVNNEQIFVYNQFIESQATHTGSLVLHKVNFLMSSSTPIPFTFDTRNFSPYVTSLSLREIDRPRFDPISSSQEGGVDEMSFGYNSTIFASSTGQYSSFAGVARNTKMIRDRFSSQCLFTWARPIAQNFVLSGGLGYQVDENLSFICSGKARLTPRYKNEQTGSMKIVMLANLMTGSTSSGWSGLILVSTSFGFLSTSLVAGSTSASDSAQPKYLDVPIYRQNLSSSLGAPTPFGVEDTSLMDFRIFAYLTGSPGVNDKMNLYTIQGFQLDD